jgi:diguanylate cyclase (GGDEF)-like protein/PAS domain S-box-containing protein
MYRNLFQQLTHDKLERYARELEQAIEDHAGWLSRFNRTLICQLPASSDDLNDSPHHLCKFGRWYYGIDEPVLAATDSFQQIGEVHKQMHLATRELLLKARAGERITADEYDALIELSDELRFLMRGLRRDLYQNQLITSRLMGKVFENAHEGVIITAPDTTIITVNKAFTEVTGYSAEEVIGQRPDILRSDKQDSGFYQRMWEELKRFGEWQGEIWNRNKRGEIYLEWLSIAEVKDDEGNPSHYIGVFSDITSEKENEERLHYLAHYDQLTNLPNRILFTDRLKHALSLSRRARNQVAVMFLDLDGFKEINDSLGHASGDELLHQVAERLTACLRESDTVARFGGDEFTIVLPEIDSEESVAKIARKITKEIAKPYDLNGSQASVTTSIGISIYPTDGQQAHTLIQKADKAMYHAKRHGKNHHEFYAGETAVQESSW